MARVSIYVPDDLKQKMDVLGDSVNWSSAAQAAFEQELNKHRWKEDKDDMNQVIERIRSSKADFEKAQAATGHPAGVNWAKNSASYESLLRMQAIDMDNYNIGVAGETSLADWVNYLMDDGGDPLFDRDPVTGRMPSDEYVEAFLDGVNDVWNEVSSKL